MKEAWSFTTGVQAGHEAAPLVAGGRIFVVTPYPNYVFALDLEGKVQWKFDPKTRPSS
ncbi:MAG TPA: PQQ-binding-like beta-propeller repeat protein [Burkholderiales bacterium]|nr:PQQ-binding-like beta-propeller repeat protein [Burkholderiales bacterium]